MPGHREIGGRLKAMAKHKETMQQTSKANNFSRYYKRGLWCCSASPTGAHHWHVDGSGIGQCKYCGERRQFAKPAIRHYVDTGCSGWSQSVPLEESLRELLPSPEERR